MSRCSFVYAPVMTIVRDIGCSGSEGHPPAVALFATNARYKREAYRGSEFAPRIVHESGLTIVMKVRLLVSTVDVTYLIQARDPHPNVLVLARY